MELFRAFGALIEPPDPQHAAEHLRLARLLGLVDDPADLPPAGLPAADVYADLFLFQLYPYASVYLGAEGMLGGEARDRVAGFLRTLGATPPKEPDHLAYLLASYGDLATPDDEQDPRHLHARRALLWEHLLSWLPGWLHALRRLRIPDFYLCWADLLDEALRREAADLGPPDALPLHLREAPPLGDPRETGAETFVRGLLAPPRSGLILVRDDLRRAADQLGLGLRAGERRFVVEHLLAQDAPAVLAWLAGEAGHWSEFWRTQDWLGPIADWWHQRAARLGSSLAC